MAGNVEKAPDGFNPVRVREDAGRKRTSTFSECIVIGASTGGAEAIKLLLQALPVQMPPILIAQHMPERFTSTFAARLDECCRLSVKEARDSEVCRPGWVYVAPGSAHLSVARLPNGELVCQVRQDEKVNRYRPSVDVLFFSAAKIVGTNCIGVLLTGMGKDGAEGLLAMRHAGAYTIAQDQQSSVVYGMPRAAVALGAVNIVLPLDHIAGYLLRQVKG